jgi:hypothetical protein
MLTEEGDEQPVRGDLGVVVLLVTFGIVGLLLWGGLFFSSQWLVSTGWTAVVGGQADASPAHILPASAVAPIARSGGRN